MLSLCPCNFKAVTLLVETPPIMCATGHRLRPGRLLIGWLPCSCAAGRGGHRTWQCKVCDSTTYEPPHRDAGEAAERHGYF